jgi:hypothetical protein
MKKLAAVITSIAFGGAAMIAPALATTSASTDTGDYSKHAADCLALLFTNPKAHAEQCGGPNFVVPEPPHGSTGSTSVCNQAEIDPFGIDGVQYKLVAQSNCCIGSVSPDQWQPLGTDRLVWNEEATRIAVAAC